MAAPHAGRFRRTRLLYQPLSCWLAQVFSLRASARSHSSPLRTLLESLTPLRPAVPSKSCVCCPARQSASPSLKAALHGLADLPSRSFGMPASLGEGHLGADPWHPHSFRLSKPPAAGHLDFPLGGPPLHCLKSSLSQNQLRR